MARGSASHKNSDAVAIYGFQLGAAYKDAMAQAGQGFTLQEDGPEDHRGEGTLDGMKASLTLAGRSGKLVDIQLRLLLDKGDKDLATSKPFTQLAGALGKPGQESADLAVWKPAGFEVSLQRQTMWTRGEDTPKVEYAIRGRVMASAATRPAGQMNDEEAKEREIEDSSN